MTKLHISTALVVADNTLDGGSDVKVNNCCKVNHLIPLRWNTHWLKHMHLPCYQFAYPFLSTSFLDSYNSHSFFVSFLTSGGADQVDNIIFFLIADWVHLRSQAKTRQQQKSVSYMLFVAFQWWWWFLYIDLDFFFVLKRWFFSCHLWEWVHLCSIAFVLGSETLLSVCYVLS